nr:hypothetical protein [Tanacetum cinerariifolium]
REQRQNDENRFCRHRVRGRPEKLRGHPNRYRARGDAAQHQRPGGAAAGPALHAGAQVLHRVARPDSGARRQPDFL